ncbi:MAG TPA: chromosome segregation protein SMC [Armatimonadota bacterium]|jgi:chromosome segregation protein
MTLKRLDLFGFKTFAERTEVEFPVGVTAVVGPNGSGKSNISDSILWVLGESNVRHLRGDRAQDVIFAGTNARKPLGMAEASLTFDNSDRRLPMDDPEVTVTRRVYRSGEGEYFINRSPCRLKDIHDLFLDTGVGRDAYNMVGQSDIDSILSARPEERRQLFEEAAGIKKYRARKNEALRKLESTSANLLRVTDILAEISRSVAPLERAASTARAFRDLDARRAGLERVVLAHDAHRFHGEMSDLTDQARAIAADAEAGRTARAEAEAQEAAARLRLTEMERTVEDARARLEDLRAERTRRDAERAILAQRRDEAARRDQELAETLSALHQRLKAANREHAEASALAETLAGQLEAVQAKLAEARAASEAERTILQTASRRLQALRAEETRLQRAVAARTGEARGARAEANRLAPALARLEERKATLEAQREIAAKSAQEAAARTAELETHRAACQAAREAAEANRAALDVSIAEADRALASLRREIAGLAARRRTLSELSESHEGFFAGVRAVLNAAKQGALRGDFQAVADVIHVPSGLETAIETALGGQLQDIICLSDADAKAAIAFLKRENAGRATFLPLDLLKPSPRVNVRKGEGILGWAADLVGCDAVHREAIELLLGRVLVVDDLDIAVSLVRRDRLPIRIVSVDGEIVSGSGSITGGKGKGGQSHLLARKREMLELGEEIAAKESSAQRAETAVAESKVGRAAADEAARAAIAALNDERMQSAEASRRKQYAESDAQRCVRELASLAVEAKAAEDRAAQLAQQADALEAAAEAAQASLQPVLLEIADLEGAAQPNEKRRAELMALEVEAAQTRERHGSALADATRAAAAARTTDEEISRRADQREAVRKQSTESSEVGESLKDVLATLDAGIRDASAALETQRQGRDALLTEAAGARERAHVGEERAAAAAERLRKVETRIAGLTSERTHILVRLREILWPETVEPLSAADEPESGLEGGSEDEEESPAIGEDEARELLNAVEIPADFSRHSAIIELNRLRRQINELGPVNLGAEKQHAEATERHAFLTAQRDDLVNAEETLRRAIKEIDQSTRQTFLETFEKVEAQFSIMFHRLFGGGITKLVLTDPNDVLETGIDIIVQPPGKKLQNLQLLSGGERALTASALLFAFLRVKASPFVVLDEVDAPLDEANVGRFAAVLREFSHQSQFIVITHNRGTMEAAHALYGVTMQEPGISRLVSLRLEDKAPLLAALS